MPRLRLSLPEELGSSGDTMAVDRTEAERPTGRRGRKHERPRIVRWLACWASGLER